MKGFNMAKSKLLAVDGGSIVSAEETMTMVPKIKGLQPCGSQVLVEMLTVQELSGTSLTISDKTDLKVPMQGYIRATGPSFQAKEWGFGVGDRVLISGGGVLAPNHDECHRDRFFMEPHSIKSVLLEQK
jgi:hypothetical protein